MDLVKVIVGVVAALFCCFFVGIIVLFFALDLYTRYKEQVKERARSGEPLSTWSVIPWLLIACIAVAVLGFVLGANIVTRISLAAALIITAPLVCNRTVVAYRTVVGWYHRWCGTLHNPLLDRFHAFYASQNRRTFPPSRIMRKYSWGLPTREVLERLASYGPLVEVGAGTGYWTWLLRQLGVDVVAYDVCTGPSLANHHHLLRFSWVKIRKADAATAAASHPFRTLFLCWPPADDNTMSSRALAAYQGERVVYIGAKDELIGADTGNLQFHRLLREQWTLEEKFDIPCWGPIRDTLRVYRRRAGR